MSDASCSACPGRQFARGLCRQHYDRSRRAGVVTGGNVGTTLACGECTTPFVVVNGRQLYCSAGCRDRAESARWRARRRAAGLPTWKPKAAEPAVRTALACQECGEEFFPTRPANVYCSRRCKERVSDRVKGTGHRGRARFFGVEYERVDRSEVFERDGWRCGICGGGVDAALRWPHPGSASLDHRVPMARGGAHRWDNVQCAHLACNIEKGDRLAVEDSAEGVCRG